MLPGGRNLLAPETVRSELPERFPLLRPPPPVPKCDPRAVTFGLSHFNRPVSMPERPRFEHAHVIGTTGGGKTNFLEHLFRQDVKKGDGALLIDPHGNHPDSVYRSAITWAQASGLLAKRKVHLIDPNFTGYTTGFNPLALPNSETSVSVVAGVALEAIERAWGDEDTHTKPTIRRLLKATFAALAELRLTLSEAQLLFDQDDQKGVRALALCKLHDRYARDVLLDLNRLAGSDRNGMRFRDEIVGPLNRLAEFLSSPAIRRIVGQTDRVLDLRQCMDEGHVVLVNLSSGDAVNDADTELLGRLLTRMLFFHAKRRTNGRPFWFYLDECQRYLSGDVPALLAEARKFRVGVILSHQWQSQLGEPDSPTLAAVRNATNLKVVFRIKDLEEAKDLAGAVVPLDLETPVVKLIQPKVVAHRRTTFEAWGESEHHAYSTSRSVSIGESTAEGFSDTIGDSSSRSASTSDGRSTGTSEGESQANGISTGESSSVFGSSMNGIGASSGVSLTPEDPNRGWFTPSQQEEVMNFEGTSASSATGTGHADATSYAASSVAGSSAGRSEGRNHSKSQGTSLGQSRARTTSRSSGTSYSETVSEGETHGTSKSHAVSEGLEPVYENLPGAVHGMENMLYFAAQALRSLKTGEAYVHYAGAEGIAATQVLVPRVRTVVRSDAQYAAIRAAIMDRSSAALPASDADRAIEAREELLFAEAGTAADPEPSDTDDFRVPLVGSRPRPSVNGSQKLAGAPAVKGVRQRRRLSRP